MVCWPSPNDDPDACPVVWVSVTSELVGHVVLAVGELQLTTAEFVPNGATILISELQAKLIAPVFGVIITVAVSVVTDIWPAFVANMGLVPEFWI